MEEEPNFEELYNDLQQLKQKELSDEKANKLIDLMIRQNDMVKSVFSYAVKLTLSIKDVAELTNNGVQANNRVFETIHNWMNSQNSRNDSVDEQFEAMFNDLKNTQKRIDLL